MFVVNPEGNCDLVGIVSIEAILRYVACRWLVGGLYVAWSILSLIRMIRSVIMASDRDTAPPARHVVLQNESKFLLHSNIALRCAQITSLLRLNILEPWCMLLSMLGLE